MTGSLAGAFFYCLIKGKYLMAITDIRTGVTPSAAIKMPADVATTANIALSGLLVIDGYQTVEGDRVLVKDQTNQIDNGIWSPSTGNWSRTSDASKTGDFAAGTIVVVSFGTVNGGVSYRQTADTPAIGTVAITFALLTGIVDPNGNKIVNGAVATTRYVEYQTGGVARFRLKTDDAAEAGSNAGSDFAVERFADDGTSLGNVVKVTRSTGVSNYTARPTWNGIGLATVDEAIGAGGGVDSFNGRTGIVVADSADYNSTQITHGVETVSAALGRYEVRTPWLVPESYGAVGDGVADDGPAIQSMIDALGSRGGWVTLPPKRYRIATAVSYKNKPIKITGSNGFSASFGTHFVCDTGANPTFSFGNVDGSEICGFSAVSAAGHTGNILDFVTNPDNPYGAGSGGFFISLHHLNLEARRTGLQIRDAFYYRLRHCRIEATDTASGVAMKLGGASDNDRADNVECVQCVFAGPDVAGTTTDCIQLLGAANSLKFLQCGLLFGRHGLYARDPYTTGVGVDFLYWANGGSENCRGVPFYIDVPSEKIMFSNFYCSNKAGDDPLMLFTSAVTSGPYAAANGGEIVISGGLLRGSNGHAIDLTSGTATITGNRITNGSTNVNGASDGIVLRSGLTDAQVTGNRIGPGRNRTQRFRYGINNLMGATPVIIQANDLRGAATAGIGGTTTGAGIANNLS